VSLSNFIANFLIGIALYFCVVSDIYAFEKYRVIDMKIVGDHHRTDESWIRRYLDIELPAEMEVSDLEFLRSRILTTQVFTEATLSFVPVNTDDSKDYILEIELDEKWTTIPVLRGAYGGGTPLRVVGIYDTHTFGRLWTLGAEARKYGEAPWGGVAWAKAPRLLGGRHVFGFEVWRQYRERTIYNKDDEELGYYRSDWSLFRTLYMIPVDDAAKWKVGLDLRFRKEAPAQFKPTARGSSSDANEIREPGEVKQFAAMPRFVYDTIAINNLNHRGVRLLGYGGPLYESDNTASLVEGEVFYYKLFAKNKLNFAFHLKVGQTTTDSLESQYFLGGLDSVRGVPEGAIYGTRASYSNTELRHISLKFKHLWVQSVAFLDAGGAGSDWKNHRRNYRSSAGLGFRISIPKVYRLMFRFDYAWSLDDPGSGGFSAGMNQFFQPYKPL